MQQPPINLEQALYIVGMLGDTVRMQQITIDQLLAEKQEQEAGVKEESKNE